MARTRVLVAVALCALLATATLVAAQETAPVQAAGAVNPEEAAVAAAPAEAGADGSESPLGGSKPVPEAAVPEAGAAQEPAAAPEAAAPAAAEEGATAPAAQEAAPAADAAPPAAQEAGPAGADAAPAAEQKPAEPAAEAVEENTVWSATVKKIDEMREVCKAIKAKWMCNSGNHVCTWVEGETPTCVVPEAYVKARLIESTPCPGSLMESWFGCQAQNNNKGGCLARKGCAWTDWANYTSLPIPTRRLLSARVAGDADAAVAREPGGCQLAEVLEKRSDLDWDGISALAFRISHLDAAVWGACRTAKVELANLVPAAARQACSAAPNAEACSAAAPLCKWEPLPGVVPPPAGSPKGWPTHACAPTCATADQAVCEKYDTCDWNPALSTCGANNGTRAAWAPAPRDPRVPLTGIAARVAEACANIPDDAKVSCAAQMTLHDAAYSLIELGSRSADSDATANLGAAAVPAAPTAPAAAAPAAAPPRHRSGAEALVRPALWTVAGLMAAAALMP